MSQSDSKEYITIEHMCMYHNHNNEYEKQSHELFHPQIHKYMYVIIILLCICHNQTETIPQSGS